MQQTISTVETKHAVIAVAMCRYSHSIALIICFFLLYNFYSPTAVPSVVDKSKSTNILGSTSAG